jgi:putative ABC transport system ATP-binding protein
VKYEQVREQFEPPQLVDPALQILSPKMPEHQPHPLAALNVTISDGSGAHVAENVSLKIEMGETVAMIDNAGSGAEAIAEAFGRLVWPTSGKIMLGATDLLEVPEAVSGRQITYAAADSYFFHGTLKENLLYGLKHAPTVAARDRSEESADRRWEIDEAERAGNSILDPEADWIDVRSTSVSRGGPDDLNRSILGALDAVQLTSEVMELALHSFIDPEEHPTLTERVVQMRFALREELTKAGIGNIVAHFDFSTYNKEATVRENLLFAASRLSTARDAEIVEGEYVFEVLKTANLFELLYNMGLTIAENLVEMFSGLPPEHPLFQQLDHLTADDIAFYTQFMQKRRRKPDLGASETERRAVVKLSLYYIEPRYRFGVLSKDIMDQIVAARDLFYANLPVELRDRIERYDPHRYMSGATLRENILFGKLSHRSPDAPAKIHKIAARLTREMGLYDSFIDIGLSYDVGASGRRLTLVQRHKLSLARALVRRSSYYIFNKALPGLDRRAQEEIVNNVLHFLQEQDNNPSVVWVLSNTSLSRLFHRVIVFDKGSVVEDGSYETLDMKSGIFRSLVA